ncbi:MAG: pilus assembly protein [Anaerolineae bacterium]|nr:pilus assembly protein [Anaerolineae bacterium]
MDTLQNSKHLQQRRKGQSLAEFAITLPIVLILLFGIVEFGRIFQAWVTLQNSARAAARYASTGQFYADQFPLNLNLNAETPSDPGGFIPCVDDGPEDWRTYDDDGQPINTDRRGTKVTYTPPGADSATYEVYQGGIESLFATWNDGRNCDPGSEADQESRRDMARILSIFEEARRGAAGLAIEFNQLTYPTDKTVVEDQPWFEVWKNPQPRNDQRSWFNVVVCSTRSRNDPESGKYFKIVDDTGTNDADTRFVTNLGDTTLRDPSGTDLTSAQAPVPGCLLNEIPQASPDGLNNAGKPWLDPGGPADTVIVIVTFNHPLVTPLGLAPYIQMQARRTAIVESFRAADPRTVLGGSAPIRPPEPTLTPSLTAVPATPIPTSEPATKTPTREPTATATVPPPFTCSLITASSLVVNGGRIEVSIRNQNTDSTFLTRVIVKWPTILQYPDMGLINMALNEAPHWQGFDASDINAQTNTTDTNANPSNPNYFSGPGSNELDRTIAGYDTGLWSSTFSGGPTFLQQFVSMYDFAGTTFYLFNPLDPDNPCAIQLVLPTPTDVPDGFVSPTPTATFTPDCASAQISVRWGGFLAFGVVRLEVRNDRNVPATLSDFTIQWRQRAPGVVTLSRVTVVEPPGDPNAVTIWEATNLTQDSTPPTSGRGEAAWVRNHTFGPGSITSLYIDFDGVGGVLSDIGVTPSDFNGTQFRLSCGTTGGGTNGPGGGPPDGLINLSEAPTPAPTNTRGPTRTPAPTLTPSKTFTPAPPTNTPTRGPTNTPRPPTNTPLAPTATTPPPPPTLPGGGCVDNCG